MSADNQLRLQMNLPENYDYGTWVRHAGVEDACDRLALWRVHGGRLWLTSGQPAGKSHLLRTFSNDDTAVAMLDLVAIADRPATSQSSARLAQLWLAGLEEHRYWLIDLPAGSLPQAGALALFHILERARDVQSAVAIAWRGEAESLPPELSSRLLAMETLQMCAPEQDDALLQVLRSSAGSLQWDIREQVLQAMLTYLPRQLDILMPALKELERRSFEQKHKPGPAWVKQQLLGMNQALQSRLFQD